MPIPQVVIVDDEPALRSVIADLLAERHINARQAADGVEALDLLIQNAGIALLLSDVKMPRMGGYELVEKALSLRPELKVVMMTGYAAEQPPPPLLRAREIRTLAKPVDLEQLCDLVTDMLGRP